MTESAIEVVGLSKKFRLATERRDSVKERVLRGRGRYEEFWALRDVSFTVPKGTTFGLIGHNGSGKSTLLKMLAGIYRPTSGTVTSRGRMSALLELGAGFHAELTGRENIRLNGAILGLTHKQTDAAMDKIIDFSGIGQFIDAPVKVYSSGMYVRLGFAIAVTVDPEILVVDEIIAVGDEEFQRKCFDYLFELRKRGTTIVIVSHALGVLSDLCDEAVWVDHGRLEAVGDVRDVVESYLRAVNAKEAGRTSESATDHAEPGRVGSGEVRVTHVQYLDADGAELSFVTPGERVVIRLHYSASEPIPEAVFGLAFVHESGVNVSGPNSGYDEKAFQLDAGVGYVDYVVDSMPLQPGMFTLSTAVVGRGHMFDYRDRAVELRVRADSPVTEPGLVRFDGRWSLTQGGSAAPALPTAERKETLR